MSETGAVVQLRNSPSPSYLVKMEKSVLNEVRRGGDHQRELESIETSYSKSVAAVTHLHCCCLEENYS